MPGVSVRTATRSGPVNAAAPASGRYFVGGITERGRAGVAVRIRSLAEYLVEFGGRVPYGSVYDDLRVYFEEGGSEAYVSRVVGPAAAVGTLTLKDRAGTPANTLRIDAVAPGSWSSDVTVEVAAGTNAGTYAIRVRQAGQLVETFDNLTSPADAVGATRGSRLIRATDLGSVTAAPGNFPAVLAATALSAGTDDRASITAAHVTAALNVFGLDLGAGAVALPGYAATLVGRALIDHAKATRRIALLATAQGATPDQAIAASTGLIGPDAEYAGLFYPWLTVPVAGSSTKLLSPEGYVAAMRARAHRDVGPWRAPAGDIAVATFVTGVERELTRAEGDRLDEAHVSAIRTISGTTRLYGWRSLSSDVNNYALLIGRDVLNTVAYAAEEALEQYVFQTIDGQGRLIASVQAELIGLLDPIRDAGGLYERIVDGERLDPGYSVDVGPTVNTLAVLNSNTIAAVVAMRVSPVGTLIDLTIVKAGLTANV